MQTFMVSLMCTAIKYSKELDLEGESVEIYIMELYGLAKHWSGRADP